MNTDEERQAGSREGAKTQREASECYQLALLMGQQ